MSPLTAFLYVLAILIGLSAALWAGVLIACGALLLELYGRGLPTE